MGTIVGIRTLQDMLDLNKSDNPKVMDLSNLKLCWHPSLKSTDYEKVIISSNEFYSISDTTLPPTVKTIDASNNKINYINCADGFHYLKELNLNNNKLNSFVKTFQVPNVFTNVEVLHLKNNLLRNFTPLPSLKWLDISENPNIDKFECPAGLITLYCDKCNINNTSFLNEGIMDVVINRNKLTLIKDLPSSITVLDISYNPIKEIESFPINLCELCVDGINFESFGIDLSVYTKLEYFMAKHCNLTVVPKLPESIESLHLSYNNITEITLEQIPKSVTEIDISCNNIIDKFGIHNVPSNIMLRNFASLKFLPQYNIQTKARNPDAPPDPPSTSNVTNKYLCPPTKFNPQHASNLTLYDDTKSNLYDDTKSNRYDDTKSNLYDTKPPYPSKPSYWDNFSSTPAATSVSSTYDYYGIRSSSSYNAYGNGAYNTNWAAGQHTTTYRDPKKYVKIQLRTTFIV